MLLEGAAKWIFGIQRIVKRIAVGIGPVRDGQHEAVKRVVPDARRASRQGRNEHRVAQRIGAVDACLDVARRQRGVEKENQGVDGAPIGIGERDGVLAADVGPLGIGEERGEFGVVVPLLVKYLAGDARLR